VSSSSAGIFLLLRGHVALVGGGRDVPTTAVETAALQYEFRFSTPELHVVR
jgi:hypothetical protein